MSNKSQKEISKNIQKMASKRRENICKNRCDLRIVGGFLCSFLLLTLSTLCAAASAKLESIAGQLTTAATYDHHESEIEYRDHGNQLEYEHFYHSELNRLLYETINRILRDEQEPIFRRDDTDIRYYHARSLQPTHEVVRRSTEDELDSKIRNLNLRAQNLSEFQVALNSTPNYLDGIITIDLSENQLEAINLNDFKNLLTANLSKNLLNEIPIKWNSTLQLLDLNSNHIQKGQVPRNDHLRTLYLSGNNIENLTALNLSLLNALETLDLSCNRIKNLETTFFPRLMHNLKYLNLAYNQLGSISRETFFNLLSLNTLLLAHNDITFIDYETFLSLPNLQYLDLSHNRLRGESIRALQGIPDLVGLSIAYNPEMGESLQEFVASWSLKEVDASGTGLCQIPAALAQAVRTLKLADNWFKIINCGDLDSYPLLQHLDLSFSHIEDIEDDAMGRLEFLEILFLDHNQLHKVPVSLPTSLEHLFLQHNGIMDVQIQAFQGLKNLKTLDLSHNKLLYLPALPLPKLLTLNLQSSGLQGLNQAIVHSLPHLRDLLLEENPIKCSDLLGIAEWASPCRIADRTNSKAMDIGEQIGNLDVGQQQQEEQEQQQQQQQRSQQTVAEIDLKQKFVQTHNFYEKFNSISGNCNCTKSKFIGRQMLTSITPPSCAIELDENVEEAIKPTSMLDANETSTKNVVETTTTKYGDAYSNEENKVYEHNFFTSDLNGTFQTHSVGSSKNQTENSKLMNATRIHPTSESDVNLTLNLRSQTATTTKPNKVPTKNVEITIVPTTTTTTPPSTKIVNDMPMPKGKTTFYAINSENNSAQIISMLKPTTQIASTSASTSTSTSPSELNNSIETTTTATTIVNTGILLPQTMPTKMPTTKTMTTEVSNYGMSSSSSTRGSLLERQRRVEIEQATMITTTTRSKTTTDMPKIMDKILATTLMTKISDEGLKRNIANDNERNHDDDDDDNNDDDDHGDADNVEAERKISKTFNNSKNLKILKTSVEAATISAIKTPAEITPDTTTSTPQRKHVPLQLHVKDRHLIGTPLLTHQGQNLLVASDKIHTRSKPTNSPPAFTNSHSTQHQIEKIETQPERSDNSGLSTTENGLMMATKATRRPSSKVPRKPHNDQLKKKLSLIMKKMTITTKHLNSTIATNSGKDEKKTTQQDHQKNQQNHHHHYTLNTPRENEVMTVMMKSPPGNSLNSNHQSYLDNSPKHQMHHSNIKHSTVNTPIINGHENELQTFQEHNELEAEAAAIAASAHAHASTSKSGSTTTSTSAKWFDLRKTATADGAHPGIVILLSFGLFVVLLIGLLHVYRCDIPWPLRRQRQRQQQRPHRIHQQQQQQQQTHFFNDDDVHSFLSYQSNCSNQFNQRKWRLETNQKQNQHQHQQQQQQSKTEQNNHQQHQSPFHNLQVRELQQTSAVEPGPKYAKRTYKINSALGERSNSQSSSTCSPHSSDIFDDETFYVEMTTEMGHTAINTDPNTFSQGDLLPMELLNVSKGSKGAIGKNDELRLSASSQATNHSGGFQTSSIDDDPATQQSSSKLTPTTRKLGIW